MSKYTTELRYICEVASGLTESKDNASVEEIIDKAVDKIFNFDFPIFDEAYRRGLEKKILRHFYTREISEETMGLWKLRLNCKLNEIMPYYNQLYKSELIEFNPLYSKNLNRKGKRNTNESGKSDGSVNSESHSESGGSSSQAYSDTPQGELNDVRNLKYLTNATVNESSGTNDGHGTVISVDSRTNVGEEEYFEDIVGYEGVNPNKMLKEFRSTFLNIDMKVIDELDILFMQIW